MLRDDLTSQILKASIGILTVEGQAYIQYVHGNSCDISQFN